MAAKGSSSRIFLTESGKKGMGMILPASSSTAETATIRTPSGEMVKKVITYTSIQNAVTTSTPNTIPAVNKTAASGETGSVIP